MSKIEMKRIEDGLPPLGSWVLCKYKPEYKAYSSWGAYQVLFYGYHGSFPAPTFWLYDLTVPSYNIESYQVIETTDSREI